MTTRFLLLILPALALAKIDIAVSGKFDPEKPDIKVSPHGFDVAVINDAERDAFKLNDENLKSAVELNFGKRPDDTYLHSPTPWGDLFKSYNWSEVTRTLKARKAEILGIHSQPVMVLRQTLNNNTTNPGVFTLKTSQTVENTVISSWNKNNSFTFGQEISYGLIIEIFHLGGTTSLSYTYDWGESETKKEKTIIGSSSGMEMKLKPGQGVVADLQSTRGKIKVEVEYEATLSGGIAINYADTYQGHHFWLLDIVDVMRSGSISNSVVSKEVIEIDFFSNSTLVVNDISDNALMMALPL